MFLKKYHDELMKLEPYRIKTAHSNAAYKIPLQGQFIFLKIYGCKHPRFRYEMRRLLSRIGIRQPIEYTSPQRRKVFEEDILRHWSAHGFKVPAIITNPYSELAHFSLATKFIHGITLREIVQDKTAGWYKKEETIAELFREVNRRHQKAFILNDNKLFHIDANTRNIIFENEIIYHVDFEMGRPWEPSIKCASREILKMLVCVTEDAPASMREPIINLFKKYYSDKAVYNFIKNSILKRPFQALHRVKDRKKKMRNPAKVTLYDILHYLQ